MARLWMGLGWSDTVPLVRVGHLILESLCPRYVCRLIKLRVSYAINTSEHNLTSTVKTVTF